MGSNDFKYGIFVTNELLTDLSNPQGQRTAMMGQIVKIEAVLANEKLGVRFLKNGEQWESITFKCNKKVIASIDEKLWPFLASIPSPQERVKLARNTKRCKDLKHVAKDMVVGFYEGDEVYLGEVKYMGKIKSMGHGVGLKLHSKKKDNTCNGSYAGIQYFGCLAGYGFFTTIDRLYVVNNSSSIDEPSARQSELDLYLEENFLGLVNKGRDEGVSAPKYEEIVTKYGETSNYQTMPSKNSSYIRNSLSLQNIVDMEGHGGNSNNDFDQNSVIQPDKTYLIEDSRKTRNKSEMDLIDVIGSWHGASDGKNLEKFSKNVDKNDNYHNHQKSASTLKLRNKSANPMSHFYVDMPYTSTYPKIKKSEEQNEPIVKKAEANHTKINEKNEAASSSPPSKPKYSTPKPGSTHDLSVGTLVEVLNDISKDPLYGVVRWMGSENGTGYVLVGVELDEEQSHLPLTLTDGTHNGERYFKCALNRALFVPLEQCHRDSRFQDGLPTPILQATETIYDSMECPVIQGAVAPLCMPTEEDVEAVCGKCRGIQGHHNSCYLDVTLFSMFTYTAVFDSLLFRPKGPNDIADYEEVQRVLREEIVNPLRKNLFVSANHVMNLRKLLDRLSSVSGLTSEEKDPEEFLNSLLAQILKAEPFLKLNSGQEAFHYQLFVVKDENLTLPTVQQLFEQSFLTSNIKLNEVPSCLIIQMPRFGKNYKMYPRILPSQLLDVTDVIEESPRQCTVCGKLAKWECRECFDDSNNGGLESTAFCKKCLERAHQHERRHRHKPVALKVSPDFSIMENHCSPPRLFMELFAVICIETSHYVAFVKCGVGHEAPWCFFDSMADRKGEKNGYNIPEMVACPDISTWLSDEQICRQLHEEFPSDRHLPEHARRLLCDAYICMYQSSDVMMYR